MVLLGILAINAVVLRTRLSLKDYLVGSGLCGPITKPYPMAYFENVVVINDAKDGNVGFAAIPVLNLLRRSDTVNTWCRLPKDSGRTIFSRHDCPDDFSIHWATRTLDPDPL